ncbi:hypothetical protein FRB96_001817 [Tulasnella sp. 330]|nr:hypothetical protein FRB96_001817 [Tulasnella sp. 330]KAG8867343.1 hypothetical protein FRB97_003381 [Tulasnella sp. 331]KAG8869366.1 hypothetical protein FRB98_002610 [Tulasnella sp. 332]
MPDWSDPATIASEAVIFNKIIIACLGFLVWETIITFWFDLEVITRKRAFKWPMVVYWIAKYSVLLGTTGVVVSENITTAINCEALFVVTQLLGNTAIGSASTLLMLRTIAVWTRNRFVMYPIILFALGQWAILLHDVTTVSAEWSDALMTCAIKPSPTINLKILYLYTMAFDFGVLVVTSVGLYRLPGRQVSGNHLWSMLFKDGLVFFLVAFTSNLIAVIFVLAELNPIMSIIATIPAASISTVVSCRLFIKLTTYNDGISSNHTTAGRTGAAMISKTVRKTAADPFQGSRADILSNGGVHVQMDTFVSHTHGPTFSNVNFADGRDLESQHDKGTLPYAADNASSEDFADEKPNMKSFMPK